MKRIFVCSPYAGNVEANVKIAEDICKDMVRLGYAPFAPHLFYTRFLDDGNITDRKLGIICGQTFMEICDEVCLYSQNGISDGMNSDLDYAKSLGKPIKEYSFYCAQFTQKCADKP